MMRGFGLGGWFGGPATRRLETGTRDAKTDVWMVWLQALSSVAILGADMLLTYSWLLIIPHWLLETVGYLVAVLAAPVAVFAAFQGLRFAQRLYGRFIVGRERPLWDSRKICAPTAMAVCAAAVALCLWDKMEWHWLSDFIEKEFPGRAWPLLHYVLYGGACLTVWVGSATAFVRWWAKEIPDAVRPETETGGDLSYRKQELAEAKFAEQQARTADILEQQRAEIADLRRALTAMTAAQKGKDKGM